MAQTQHMVRDHDLSVSQENSTWSCVRCDKKFKTERESSDHFAQEHNVNIKEEPKPVKEGKLNYVLDELKNMKVAKANAKRDMTLKRKETNDLNIRYDLNSALFLVTKEELDNLRHEEKYVENDVELKVESVVKQTDKADNVQ